MNFKESITKLHSSQEFNNFITTHPHAELCAGFFIIDYLANENKNSIDYKDNNKIYTFNITEEKITMQEDELMDLPNTPKLEKINPQAKIETEELKGIILDKAHEKGISAKLNKIIAVLQLYKNNETNQKEQVWNLTCMMDQLIILHIIVNSETNQILKFQRKSFMDMIKKVE